MLIYIANTCIIIISHRYMPLNATHCDFKVWLILTDICVWSHPEAHTLHNVGHYYTTLMAVFMYTQMNELNFTELNSNSTPNPTVTPPDKPTGHFIFHTSAKRKNAIPQNEP